MYPTSDRCCAYGRGRRAERAATLPGTARRRCVGAAFAACSAGGTSSWGSPCQRRVALRAEPRIAERHDEQVEAGRGDESAHDDERHRLLDLAAGPSAEGEQRDQG